MADSSNLVGIIKNGQYDFIWNPAPIPDPKDPRYIKHSAQVVGMAEFNGVLCPVRRVVISGVHLCFDATDRRGMLNEYNEKEDIKELFIIADQVTVSRTLRFPQTDIYILCRALEFNGPLAAIVTTPKTTEERALLTKDGKNGAKGGNITLYVSSFKSDRKDGHHFVANGGQAQPAEEGDIDQAHATRKDVKVITKKDWDEEFTNDRRNVVHEEGVNIFNWKPQFYTTTLDSKYFDWNKFSGNGTQAITYVELRNKCWTSFLHTATREYEVFHTGSKDEPGVGGPGLPPGKPGIGGAGGNLISTVGIEQKCRDIQGSRSALIHPGTPGGPGGTPGTAHWILFEARPQGTGSDGAYHTLDWKIETKTASVGQRSGPGPKPDKDKGDDGKYIELCARPDAKDTCAAIWITPLLLNIITQYVNDIAAAEQPDVALAALKPYEDALNGRDPLTIAAWARSAGLPELPSEVAGDPGSVLELRDNLSAVRERLTQRLDSFGNPPGWVPNLSLTSIVSIYEAVRDIALKESYNAYYLEKTWKEKQDRSDALKQLIEVLIAKTQQIRAKMIDTRNAIMQRGYTPPASLDSVKPVSIEDLTGVAKAPTATYNDMSLLEKLRSLIKQIEDLDKKRDELERELKTKADEKQIEKTQWEAVQAGLKISGAVLKALPLPPPLEMAASAAGGLLEITSTFMEKGGDNEAFKNLTTQVDSFTKTNQDGLVNLFTDGMDEELSAYNKESTKLEEASKQAKQEKDETEKNYQSVLDSKKAERAAAIKALTNRTNQRLRMRQPPPAMGGPINFNEEIAKRSLEIKKGDDETTAATKDYTGKAGALSQQIKANEAKTKELENKKKALTEAKAARQKSTKENIAKAKKLVEGVEEVAKAINKLTVSATQMNQQWDATLAKIKLEDSNYQAYIAQVAYLNELKRPVVERIVRLLGDLRDQRAELAQTLVAINELRSQYAKSGVDDLDPATLVYLQTMRDDAYRRLTHFLYILTKAYEYYTVSPWNRFYENAQLVFDDLRIVVDKPRFDLESAFDSKDPKREENERKLKQIISAASPPGLSAGDWSLLATVYEKPLRDMGSKMVELITSGIGKIDEIKQSVKLRSADLHELNARIKDGKAGRTAINFARLNVIASSNEKQRIVNCKVVRAIGQQNGERFPDDVTFKITHLGKSIVRSAGKFYAFDPQSGPSESRATAAAVTFESSGSPAFVKDNKPPLTISELKHPTRAAQQNLVGKLLGKADLALSDFRPGVFSDFRLTVGFSPGDTSMLFDQIDFELELEKGNVTTDTALVTVFNNRELAIPVNMDREDLSGRKASIGKYLGLYDGDELELKPVTITVPEQYGEYRHKGWADAPAGSPNGGASRKVSGTKNLVALYERA